MSEKKINDGGAAFPWIFPTTGVQASNEGMTLRDWFAGMALQGCIAGTPTHMGDPDEYAREAYMYADAMLARREAK